MTQERTVESVERRNSKLEGMWDEARGRVKEAWGALTDDDLDRADGRWDQLVGIIRQKTGETVDKIETKINRVLDDVEDAGPAEDRADDAQVDRHTS